MLLCFCPSYNFVFRTRRISTLTLGRCGFLFPLQDLQNLHFHCLVGCSIRVLHGYFVSRPSGSPPSYSLKHDSLFWCPCLRSVREPPYWLLLPSPCLRLLPVSLSGALINQPSLCFPVFVFLPACEILCLVEQSQGTPGRPLLSQGPAVVFCPKDRISN